MVGCGELPHLCIQIAAVFDHQILWMESIVILIFMHGVSYQRKAASDTTNMVGYGQACLLSNQMAGLFDQQYHGEEPVDIFDL